MMPRLSRKFQSRRRSRRWFVLAIGMIAGALLSLAAVPVAAAQPRQPDANLRGLLADLTTELRLVYRDNVPDYARRYEQLRAAIVAWNVSSKSDADRQRMAAWLRESIRNSMPGSKEPLPPAPVFGQPAAAPDVPSRSVIVGKPAKPDAQVESSAGAESAEAPGGDPFRDDPVDATAQP